MNFAMISDSGPDARPTVVPVLEAVRVEDALAAEDEQEVRRFRLWALVFIGLCGHDARKPPRFIANS